VPEPVSLTRPDLAVAAVAVPKASFAAAAAAFETASGVALPSGPASVTASGRTVIASGPAKFFVIASGISGWDLEKDLASAFGGLALVTDQSDGRAAFRLGGTAARAVLARGASIDLHPSVLVSGTSAVTDFAGIGAVLLAEDDGFLLLVPRSFSESFAEWIAATMRSVTAEMALAG
jgi:Sarcosine oxidase gamma subunit